ncbi:MAG: protein kinase [Fuerstiella sp.]
MNVNTCCDESLELILSDHADHPDYESVIVHLNGCTHCQQRLDDLAARPFWWENSRRYVSDLPETSVPDMPRMETLVTALVDESPEAGLADVQAFLEPPRHPEMLGRIGKYEIEREIGRGGMGIVLKGFDSELNRPVAVKLLAPHLASTGTARQRFVREGRAAAAVVHENVVAIYGIETDGRAAAIDRYALHQRSVAAAIRRRTWCTGCG